MIQLTVHDDLFWERLDERYSTRISQAYNIDKLIEALKQAVQIQLVKKEPKALWCSDYIGMIDHKREPLIEYSNDGHNTWGVSDKLERYKKKWYSLFKKKLGEFLVFDYLLKNHLVNDSNPTMFLCEDKPTDY